MKTRASSSAEFRALTRYHEAAHAVTAEWARLRPGLVRVLENGGGECWHDEPRAGRNRHDLDPLRKHLVVAVAGTVGELLSKGIDPLNAEAPPETIAKRILEQERATHAPHPNGSRPPDVRRWAVDELAERFSDEALAFEIVDEILAPDALRRATRVLVNRWVAVENIARRLEHERELFPY